PPGQQLDGLELGQRQVASGGNWYGPPPRFLAKLDTLSAAGSGGCTWTRQRATGGKPNWPSLSFTSRSRCRPCPARGYSLKPRMAVPSGSRPTSSGGFCWLDRMG